MGFEIIILGLCGLLGLGYVLLKYFRSNAKRSTLTVPGMPATHSLLGNLPDIASCGDLPKFLAQLHSKYGPVASFWWENTQVVSTYTADAFKKQVRWFNRPEWLFPNLLPFFRLKSMSFTSGDRGKQLRQQLDKAFTHEAVDSYIPDLLDIGHELISGWDNLSNDEKIPTRHLMMTAALKAISLIAFGVSLDVETSNEFIKLNSTIWDEAEKIYNEPKKRYSDVLQDSLKNMRDIVNKIVMKRKATAPTNGGRLLIDEILDSADSDEQVTDLSLNYIVAGYHTTSTLLAWMVYYIGRHPDIQERIFDELISVLGDSELVHDYQVKDLKLLKHVMDETLRVTSLGGSFAARYADEEVEFRGHKIPAQTPVIQSLSCSYANNEVFQNAQKFDPDRFSRDHIGPFDFCPFGFAGKRKCPGYRLAYAEIFCFLSAIIRKYRLVLADPDDEPKQVWGLTVPPDREIWIRVQRR